MKAANERKAGSWGESTELANEALREALMTVAGRGSAISGLALGNWIRAAKDRIVEGMRFENMGERRNTAVWRLAHEE